MSKEEVLAAIEECKEKLGRVPSFNDMQRVTRVRMQTIRVTFGTWGKALQAAGLGTRGGRPGLNRTELLDAIRECVATLGRTPTHAEFTTMKGIGPRNVVTCFGSWIQALRECGITPSRGEPVSLACLFEAWAGLVRKNGRFPRVMEYEIQTRHAAHSLRQRVGRWSCIPKQFVLYAQEYGRQEAWEDVLALCRKEAAADEFVSTTTSTRTSTTASTKISTCTATTPGTQVNLPSGEGTETGRLYGGAFTGLPMAYAPVNEMGVVLLFGALARTLGFIITWIGAAFPDGEAMREVAPGKYRPSRIEFEYESRNFLRHMHSTSGCDVIVCWIHNWPECPLEVVELSKAVNFQF